MTKKKKRGKKLGTKYVPRRYQPRLQKNVGRNCQKHKLVFSKINESSTVQSVFQLSDTFRIPSFTVPNFLFITYHSQMLL